MTYPARLDVALDADNITDVYFSDRSRLPRNIYVAVYDDRTGLRSFKRVYAYSRPSLWQRLTSRVGALLTLHRDDAAHDLTESPA